MLNFESDSKKTGHPDDIFLWPDDSRCTRDEWNRGDVSGKYDDFLVASVNSVYYPQVYVGLMKYDEYSNRCVENERNRGFGNADDVFLWPNNVNIYRTVWDNLVKEADPWLLKRTNDFTVVPVTSPYHRAIVHNELSFNGYREMLLANEIAKRDKHEGHPDDYFLSQKQGWHKRSEVEKMNAKIPGSYDIGPDNVMVVPVDSPAYTDVDKGALSYKGYCDWAIGDFIKTKQGEIEDFIKTIEGKTHENTLPANDKQIAQREPWLPTHEEIDQASVAATVKPLSQQEIKALAAMPVVNRGRESDERGPDVAGISLERFQQISATQKLGALFAEGPLGQAGKNVQSGHTNDQQRVKSPKRQQGLDR